MSGRPRHRSAVDLLSNQIEESIAGLTQDSHVDPVEAGVLLAELVGRRAALEEAELSRARSVSTELRRAQRTLSGASGFDELVATVCPAVAAIAGADFVMLSRLDKLLIRPLDALTTDATEFPHTAPPLPQPFPLPPDILESGTVPETFIADGSTVFRLDVGGDPACLVHVAGPLSRTATRAVGSFVATVGSAIELLALRRRSARQHDYSRTVPWTHSQSPDPTDRRTESVSPDPPRSLTIREQEVFRQMRRSPAASSCRWRPCGPM